MTAAPRFNLPYVKPVDGTGVPYPFAKLFFYESGTSTPLDTYSDVNLTTPNANPVVADADGLFGDIFLGSSPYKVVLKSAPYPDGDDSVKWTADPVWADLTADNNNATDALAFVIDGGGSTPGTGIARDLYIPFACTITGTTIQATPSGSCVLDYWAAPFVAGSPPTVADTITASAKPTLASAEGYIDTTLTGWTTAIAAGTWIRMNLDSVTTCTKITGSLIVTIP